MTGGDRPPRSESTSATTNRKYSSGSVVTRRRALAGLTGLAGLGFSGLMGTASAETDFVYKSGPSHGEVGDNAFIEGVRAPTGKVVFAPSDSANVGVYDPKRDTYTSGPSHKEGRDAFTGVVQAASGKSVFVPRDSDHVGVLDITG